jgi:hypothetical protein
MLVREVSRLEAQQLMQRWREIFASGVHRQTGKWRSGKKDYSALSSRFSVRALRGASAEQEYAGNHASLLTCIFARGDRLTGRQFSCEEGERVSLSEIREAAEFDDAYLFPDDRHWTLVVPAEDWVPTLFAYADDVGEP